MNYYNEFDDGAVAWLQQLMADKLIPQGIIDDRSIVDVQPGDLRGFTQCHFFAGVAGWSEALRLADWPSDRPVWTASCPCQPYSAAGKGLADADARNLWPQCFLLIRECRPLTVFGEQVEAAIGHGWLDGISSDLESEGYACGASVLGAHSLGAPHRRQRIYWVAHRLENPVSRGLETRSAFGSRPQGGRAQSEQRGGQMRLANTEHTERRPQHEHREDGCDGTDSGRKEAHGEFGTCGEVHPTPSPWSDSIWILCRDGKRRRVPARKVEQPVRLLAHGVPEHMGGLSQPCHDRWPLAQEEQRRVMKLKGFGNAIVPAVAAQFISAYLEICTA